MVMVVMVFCFLRVVMMSDAEYTEQMKIDDLEQARDNFAKMAYEQRKRAEASEARIDTLESEVEERKRLWVEAMDEAQAWKDRAEVAKARIAELEQKLANLRALVHEEQTTNNIILGQVSRADRLAEAIRDYIYRGHVGMENVKNALAAYHSDSPPQAVHPDTERLDWLEGNMGIITTHWDDDRLDSFMVEAGGVVADRKTLREAIDAAREGESDG